MSKKELEQTLKELVTAAKPFSRDRLGMMADRLAKAIESAEKRLERRNG